MEVLLNSLKTALLSPWSHISGHVQSEVHVSLTYSHVSNLLLTDFGTTHTLSTYFAQQTHKGRDTGTHIVLSCVKSVNMGK